MTDTPAPPLGAPQPPPADTPPPESDTSTATKGCLIGAGGVIALIAVITIFALIAGGDTDEIGTAGGTTPTTPATDMPSYEVELTSEDLFTVRTDALDEESLTAIFLEVRAANRGHGDSWFVNIDCASRDASWSGAPRLAQGRFPNTNLGLAQLGFESLDEYEITFTERDDCLPPPTTEAPAVESTSADEVLAALAAAGLHPPSPRDNTLNQCGQGADSLRCTKWITTDILSVTEWADERAAAEWAAGGSLGQVRVGSTTVVHFQSGGSTPPYDRPAYEAVLAGL